MSKAIEANPNAPVETARVNEDGKPLSQLQIQQIRLLGSGPGCYPNVEPETVIESHSMMRNNCTANDYQIFASFIISSENTIVAINPNNASQRTRGRVIITNTSTGSTILTNNNIQPVAISAIGADPSDPSRTRYRLTFNAQSISFANSIQNFSIRVGLFFYTECEEESQYPYTVVANLANLGSLPVCQVVHPLFYNGPVGQTYGFIAGVGNATPWCYGTAPNKQEFQISGNSSFTDLKDNEVTIGNTLVAPDTDTRIYTINIGDYFSWNFSGTRFIRFRNVKLNSSGQTECFGPWSTSKEVQSQP